MPVWCYSRRDALQFCNRQEILEHPETQSRLNRSMPFVLSLRLSLGGKRSQDTRWLLALLAFLLATLVSTTSGVRAERTSDEIQMILRHSIEELKGGRIESAIREFSTLDDKTKLPVIIAAAYENNAGNTDKLLTFIRGQPGISSLSIGYEALHKEMSKSGHLNGPPMEKLAKEVQDAMELCPYDHSAEEDKARLRGIKSNFPGVLWNGVRFKNKDYGERIFSPGNEYVFCSLRRNVYTWRNKRQTERQSDWILDPVKGTNYFKIINGALAEPLIVGEYSLCSRRRRVFTWIPKGGLTTGATWIIEHEKNSKYFKIKNVDYDEYLFADVDNYARNGDMRSMFTWRSRNEPLPQGGLWEIEEP